MTKIAPRSRSCEDKDPFSSSKKIKTLLRKEAIDTKTVLDPDMMMQKNLHRDQ